MHSLWTCLPPSPQFIAQTVQQLSRIIATHFIHVDWCFSKKLDCALMLPQQLPRAVSGPGQSPALAEVRAQLSPRALAAPCRAQRRCPGLSEPQGAAPGQGFWELPVLSCPDPAGWCSHPQSCAPFSALCALRQGRWIPSQNTPRNLPELHFSVSAEAELRSLSQSSRIAPLVTQTQNSAGAEFGVSCAEKVEWLWQRIYKPV